MSKAILVIDTPENCEECPLMFEVEGKEGANICRGCQKYSFNTDASKKPEWCPLISQSAAVRQRKNVYKKILPEYFETVLEEKKRFELRKDEDDIQAGDSLILKEWDGEHFTGREVVERVKYVLRDVPQYGLQEGYCIIGW